MSDTSDAPRHSSFGRIPRPRGFLPLSSDDVLATRGHTLPGLIQSVSTSSFQALASGIRRASFTAVAGGPADEESDPGSRQEDVDGVGSRNEFGKRRVGEQALMTPQMRSMRLIGNSNPRYQWEKYYKSEEELKQFKKPIRKYYERTNSLIEQYTYIDRLLDSSLPHTLIQEYNQPDLGIPKTISEEPNGRAESADASKSPGLTPGESDSLGTNTNIKVKRTPKNIYRVPQETTPLLLDGNGAVTPPFPGAPKLGDDDDDDGQSERRIVAVAIYINLVANTILLAAKIAVIVLTSSLSVLASLIDAALDFLSTAIVWATTRMIARRDQYSYPVGRRRLEPIGVLVFSVIMITSFFQVLLECFNRLTSGDHTIVQLGIPAIVIMASTVVIKFACWLWCRLINNSSVQALAQDAMTDVVFNTFSIIFPLVGYYAGLWPLDAVGGIVLSLWVIINWSRTSSQHIRNLTGAAATADERNVLLYVTMRFAKTIKQIQGLQAYHAGDNLIAEVDVVLDEGTSLRDSHDLGESLQYVLESVPYVDRAFVHLDYASWNLPSHMSQQD
ncbi:MAG: hypothetical protein M4579_002346 [Chaenotheca gracillima]|nr:MAG: hypothetical protein M4579_002346 [Chaenotheca gracillima]